MRVYARLHRTGPEAAACVDPAVALAELPACSDGGQARVCAQDLEEAHGNEAVSFLLDAISIISSCFDSCVDVVSSSGNDFLLSSSLFINLPHQQIGKLSTQLREIETPINVLAFGLP
jgi:hypothetical protein